MSRAKEISAIMATYEPGQVWQYRHRTCLGMWFNLDCEPRWDWRSYDYRRKPEPPAPKYRPWTPEEGIGKVVKYKSEPQWIQVVTGYSNGKFALGLGYRTEDTVLLEGFTQLDGSPCGVLETPTTN